MFCHLMFFLFFFFNDTATTEIYTLSLHDALPIFVDLPEPVGPVTRTRPRGFSESECKEEDRPSSSSDLISFGMRRKAARSEEHTSELQSPCNLVCRLLLEKKKQEHRAARDALT